MPGSKQSILGPFSFNSVINFVKHTLKPISPFCTWGNGVSERVINLPEVKADWWKNTQGGKPVHFLMDDHTKKKMAMNGVSAFHGI